MSSILSKLKSNKFFKSTLTLMSGSIIAQILAICVSPIMTRLYTEKQIGEYTLILTAVSMFGTIICGRYDLSIVSEENDKKVFALIKLSLIITVALSVVIGAGYTVYYSSLEEATLGAIPAFLWVFVLLLFTGLGYIVAGYNNRHKEYKLLTSVNVIREAARDVSLIGLGFLKFGSTGLLISQTVSVFLGLNRQAKKLKENIKDVFACTFSDMKTVAVEHKKQPLYSVPASFANSFSYSALNTFVTALFGLEMLAYYSMSFRMLGLPLALLSVNVSKVFFEKAAREYDRQKNFRKTFLQTSAILAAVAVPMVVFLMLFAPQLFEIFFGEKWFRAGEFVRYLAPMFGIRLVVSALTPTMTICKKQNWELCIQGLFMLFSIMIYFICKNRFEIETFLMLITILYSAVYIIFYLLMFKFTKEKEIKK